MPRTQPTPTVAKEKKRKLQVLITAEAYARIHASAGALLVAPGDIISDIAVRHLPQVAAEAK